jgi:adenylylsulfate kinase
VKGLYAKARGSELTQFTGITDPYETPEHPDIVIRTQGEEVERNVKYILDYIAARTGQRREAM